MVLKVAVSKLHTTDRAVRRRDGENPLAIAGIAKPGFNTGTVFGIRVKIGVALQAF